MLRIVVGVVFAATAVFVAPSAASAATCWTGSTSVPSPTGGLGATAGAKICYDNWSYRLDPTYYNYVKDQKADGYAARAWATYYIGPERYESGQYATDDTSTSTGASISQPLWAGGSSPSVYVCLGWATPLTNPSRCSHIISG
ncbi:hypothetical protein [Micromonospora sp. NPDC004704]